MELNNKFSLKRKEQSLYSGKKRKHTFTILIGVTPKGHILFVSLTYNGSNNDLNLIEYPENHVWNYITEDEYIMADKGFRGMTKGILPFIGDESKFTPDEKQFNRGFAAHLGSWLRMLLAISRSGEFAPLL
jgi:hypothetical protein